MSKSRRALAVDMPTPSAGANRGGVSRAPKHSGERLRRSQNERSEETKKRILAAAARLIARRGYAELRVADVAAEAGVSVGAQMHHFPSKDELVVGVIEYCFHEARQTGKKRAARGLTIKRALDMAIEDAKAFFFSDHFLIAVNVVLSTRPPSSMREDVLEISRSARLPVEAAWRDAMIAAGFPAELAGDVITMSFGLIRGFAIRRLWDVDDEGLGRCMALWKEMIDALIESRRKRGSRTSPPGRDEA
jgi:AcrR family transcriptional regulator